MLSVDEKSQIQALDRTQPGLPLKKGRARTMTHDYMRQGVFCSVDELVSAIDDYIDCHNDSPKPFIWTAKASEILEKIRRARLTLNKRHSD